MSFSLQAKKIFYILALVVIAIWLAIVAKPILVPLALGLLFALLLYPMSVRIERAGVPRILGNLLLILITLGIVALVFGILSQVFKGFLTDLPNLESSLRNALGAIEPILTRIGLYDASSGASVFEQLQIGRIVSPEAVGGLVAGTTNSIAAGTMAIVFSFFFLYYRNKFARVVFEAAPKQNQDKVKRIVDRIAKIGSRYVGGVAIVVSILAVINSIGFAIIGVANPIFWGIVAAIANIVPFLGTIIGFAAVALFALLTQGAGVAIPVIIMFFIVQFLENNILTPNITASHVSLNPFVALVGIFVGNMIWGVVGMLVVMPILAAIKIIADNNSRLKPIAYLLGTDGTENHAITGKSFRKLIPKALRK